MLTSELTVHVKLYSKRARLLHSHTRLFHDSLIHSFIHGPPCNTKTGSRVFRFSKHN